jgi:N-formylglutamate amidohydrolase
MSLVEAHCIAAELSPPFTVYGHRHAETPVIFNSPHSGRIYPSIFVKSSRLSPQALRKSEDAYVDELFGAAPEQGARLMCAHFPRAYVDINREPYELDPLLFEGSLPEFANSQSLRAIGGLGTIPRVVNDKEEIYGQPLCLDAALMRIDRLYKPYHQRLQQLIDDSVARHGNAFLFDCHSMPSQQGDRGGWPDFVLGDRFGTSCSANVTRLVHGFLKALGYRVALNKPYAGGYITEHYGRPHEGVHVLQIEIDRSLYMNEETFEKLPSFHGLRWDLSRLVAMLTAELPQRVTGFRAAAE